MHMDDPDTFARTLTGCHQTTVLDGTDRPSDECTTHDQPWPCPHHTRAVTAITARDERLRDQAVTDTLDRHFTKASTR